MCFKFDEGKILDLEDGEDFGDGGVDFEPLWPTMVRGRSPMSGWLQVATSHKRVLSR